MTRVILDEQGKPWFAVEVEPSEASPLRGVTDTAENVARSLADVGDVIAKASRDVLESIQAGLGALTPDEVELEFGVSLSGEVGIPMVTKASGQATFTVRVCWKPDRPTGN